MFTSEGQFSTLESYNNIIVAVVNAGFNKSRKACYRTDDCSTCCKLTCEWHKIGKQF